MVVQDFITRDRVCPSTCLAVASSLGYLSVVELLLTDPCVDPSASNNEALILAFISGHTGVIDMLLAHPRLDLAAEDNHLIRNLCTRLPQLIGRPMYEDPDFYSHEGDQSFLLVDAEELSKIIQNIANKILLLSLAHVQVDPSARDNEAIRNASKAGYSQVVRLFMSDPRVDPSAQNNEALRNATREGYEEVVKVLLSDPRVQLMSEMDEVKEDAKLQ
ncbi:hypothetical protein PROFUN_00296 [Planoprotostelium fungivorum]|uniref:Ankyrin repeat protein n=1 Tax=Planoprotostelium fungivorum TaxID=1890364 RepID=A0A2P6NY31_9EUKA|nr:hypothetical protein PROFUN_00296 [Planoprotostelium fungivorum]